MVYELLLFFGHTWLSEIFTKTETLEAKAEKPTACSVVVEFHLEHRGMDQRRLNFRDD